MYSSSSSGPSRPDHGAADTSPSEIGTIWYGGPTTATTTTTAATTAATNYYYYYYYYY